jgi:hypothetical protein
MKKIMKLSDVLSLKIDAAILMRVERNSMDVVSMVVRTFSQTTVLM